ncbi:PAS domain-containing sensor histidine kinase [Cellulomonas sp. Root485]|uniref:sensor histidine kinase n=1 Tax=Cellulomonas sp. Root485 TaxID=1736546 RepID=UPI0006FE30BC|nr:ATP-binding protein [Cellulomonas sp. Root485]KQY24102.1 PAS domain-containing sensor histidine kinase [Cellulomonas sp. Root485]
MTELWSNERADLITMGSRYLRRLARHLGPDGGVVERQLPFVGVYLVALLTLLIPGVQVASQADVVIATLLTVGQLVAARYLPWARWPEGRQDILPMIQLLAVAFLRTGTGGPGSAYTTLVFFPVITLASQRDRRGIVLAALGVAGVVLSPVLLTSTVTLTVDTGVRTLFVTLVAVVVAATVHEITARLRARSNALLSLQMDQAVLLDRARADALSLARVADQRRAARDALVSVIDSATEQAIIATDATGMVEVFNAGAERLLGYGQGEVVGRMRLTDFHDKAELEARRTLLFADDSPVDNPQALVDALVAPALAGRPEVRDWTYVARDGARMTVRLAVTRRSESDGTTTGYVVVATDVTSEREAARLQDEFVSLVSHELRTPLTSVLGYLELLTDGTDPLTDEQREYLTVIERNARRQLRLVGDLLLSAQVDAGRFSIAPHRIDVADIVRASVEAATPVADAAGVRLEASAVATPLDGDPVRLAQAVDNLVSNAIKFTPSGGTVRVGVTPNASAGADVVVADTGIGIPPDELSQLTTRFFRASTATRRAIPGVGLGLSITKAVVDAHGGSLAITSALGEGTTFTITLPPTPPG